MSASHTFLDSAIFGVKIAGLGAIGLSIEQATGYPALFWVAALGGAVFLRRPIEGAAHREAETFWRKIVAIVTAVFVAFISTEFVIDLSGKPRELMLAPVAAFTAAFGEWLIVTLRDPDRLGKFIAAFRGGRK